MSFETAYKLTGGFEGGYGNDPNDGGGETYCGIARNKHPEWKGWSLVDTLIQSVREKTDANITAFLSKNVSLDLLVQNFYYTEFWMKYKCDQLDKVHPSIAHELYDSCVNCGPGNGVKFLQRALNRLNKSGTLYPDLVEDGGIGAGTIGAVLKCCTSPLRITLLYKCMNGEQYMYYCSLKQHENYSGWFGRC